MIGKINIATQRTQITYRRKKIQTKRKTLARTTIFSKCLTLAWIAIFQYMFKECCFPCGVLTQQHYHRFRFKITVCLPQATQKKKVLTNVSSPCMLLANGQKNYLNVCAETKKKKLKSREIYNLLHMKIKAICIYHLPIRGTQNRCNGM